MKKILLALVLIGLFAFTAMEQNKGAALVNREQGIYLFVDCEPVGAYDFLGVVNSSTINVNLSYVQVKKRLVKRAVKEYPEAEAIILRF